MVIKKENEEPIKPVEIKFGTRKEKLNRLRGIRHIIDPERGPENKGK